MVGRGKKGDGQAQTRMEDSMPGDNGVADGVQSVRMSCADEGNEGDERGDGGG